MKQIRVVGAAIVKDGRCLVARRGPQMSLPGKWEFPGGKVEEGESPRQALEREILEELGLVIDARDHLATGRASTDRATVVLEVYLASVRSGSLQLLEHDEARWVEEPALHELDWAVADLPAVRTLAAHLRAQEENDQMLPDTNADESCP